MLCANHCVAGCCSSCPCRFSRCNHGSSASMLPECRLQVSGHNSTVTGSAVLKICQHGHATLRTVQPTTGCGPLRTWMEVTSAATIATHSRVLPCGRCRGVRGIVRGQTHLRHATPGPRAVDVPPKRIPRRAGLSVTQGRGRERQGACLRSSQAQNSASTAAVDMVWPLGAGLANGCPCVVTVSEQQRSRQAQRCTCRGCRCSLRRASGRATRVVTRHRP